MLPDSPRANQVWFVYEVCRLEAIASNRPIIPEPWDEREEEFRAQFTRTIERLCAPDAPPTTPEAEHNSWWQAYIDLGWTYGPVRDRELKTHPDMVPFEHLSEAERVKDEVFIAVCELTRKFVR